jgi:hypothetical protein
LEWLIILLNIYKIYIFGDWGLGIGYLGIGDWGLGIVPNPQSPIPNPHDYLPKNLNYKLIDQI